MTPPPLKDGWGFARNAIYVQKGANGAILPYVEACRRIATAEKVPLIDNFQIWTAQGSPYIKSLLPDGCHPNAAGHKVLAETILPVVLKQMPPRESTYEKNLFASSRHLSPALLSTLAQENEDKW